MRNKHNIFGDHITTQYDAQFAAAKKDGLNWYPWVGRGYEQTGIFVLGMSTDQRDGVDWTKNIASPLNRTDASRMIVAWVDTAENKPFEKIDDKAYGAFTKMAHTFVDGVGAPRGRESLTAFWESVAFNNLFQVAVKEMGYWPEDDAEVENSMRAFYKTCEILKPKLVLAWENDIAFLWPGLRSGKRKIGRVSPRVFEPRKTVSLPPIIGIGHSSRMNQSECREFLLDDPTSKQPIEAFMAHLRKEILGK